MKLTGGVENFVETKSNGEEQEQGLDEVLFKLRLKNLAEKVGLDKYGKIIFNDFAYPHKDCLFFPKVKKETKIERPSHKATPNPNKKVNKRSDSKSTKKPRKNDTKEDSGNRIFDYYDRDCLEEDDSSSKEKSRTNKSTK